MPKNVVADTKEKMTKAMEHFTSELKGIRTGRATVSMFDNVRVMAYGTPTPLAGVGSITIVDAHLVTIQPWDISLLKEIEKAIQTSGIGLNPANDGKLIRVPIPQLTEERRKEFVKVVKKMTEDAKVAVRNLRRDANEKIKKFEKDKTVSEDESVKLLDDIQKTTDAQIKSLDDISAKKEKELMEI
ncbi:ribosome recycling factor [Deferribacterales bacterium RsTz2092]